MKAIGEIGIKKTIKFIVLNFIFGPFYHLFIDHFFNLPQARKLFLSMLGSRIGSETNLMNIKFFNWHHTGLRGLVIGDRCFIGDDTLLDLYSSIEIENEVTIAQRVLILTHTNVGYKDHPLQKFFPKKSQKVLIKKGSVVGAGSIILPGITIGEQSFVAAGSVVTENVSSNTLVGGVPAKIIRKIR